MDYNENANLDDGSCFGYPENGEYSLNFDGVDDFVDINVNISNDFSNSLTSCTILIEIQKKKASMIV